MTHIDTLKGSADFCDYKGILVGGPFARMLEEQIQVEAVEQDPRDPVTTMSVGHVATVETLANPNN